MNRKYTNRLNAEQEKVVRQYSDKMKVRELAAKIDLSHHKVYESIRALNLPVQRMFGKDRVNDFAKEGIFNVHEMEWI